MRAPRRLVALSALALLVACNALTGAGDLAIGPCEGCDAVEGGVSLDSGGDVLTSNDDGAVTVDGPAGDTAKEGPGGVLDPTFGAGGMLELDLLVDPHAVAVRADGRILVVGASSGDLAAAAFTPTGALDMTFGTAGRVVKGTGNSSVGTSVAFDSQGRAVVGGTSITVTTVNVHYAYAVRIGNSQVDATFGNNGTFRGANSGQDARGVVIAPGDGAVLAVSDNNDHVFMRLGPTGTPDLTFGTNGIGTVQNVGGAPSGLVTAADGFVSGGTGDTAGQGQTLAAVKVSLVGQPANAFGTLARATSKVGPNNTEVGRSIVAQADGKLLVAGDYDPNVNLLRRVTAVTRFTSSGQLDMSYASGGKVTIDFSEPLFGRDTETVNTNVAVDSSGRALVVGSVHDKLLAGGDRDRGWVMRLRADGVPDPLFGMQGRLLLGTAPAQLQVRGAALQPDGKLVVVGVDMNGNKLFLARIITSTTQ